MGRIVGHLGRSIGAAALVAVVVLGTASGAGASMGGKSKLPKGPKIDRTKPCTLLGENQVAKAFRSTVTVDPTNSDSPIAIDCAWVVGDPAAPLGRLVAVVLYPAFGAPSSLGPSDIVESDRANSQLAGTGIGDLPIGKGGFIDKAHSFLEVAANRDLAFSLQWVAAAGPPEGAPITDAVRSPLTTLAKDITRRAKYSAR